MNEGFRECVRVIYQKLGISMYLEAGYLDRLEELNNACADWHRERAPKFGHLVFTLPDLEESGGVVFSGGLDAAEAHGWCSNAAAVDFVRWVDCRTEYQATLLMLQVVIYIQHAINECKNPKPPINTAGGVS